MLSYKKLYRKLGLTYDQVKVLSSIEYGDSIELIDSYRHSEDFKNGVSFCTSLSKFSGGEAITKELIHKYIAANYPKRAELYSIRNSYEASIKKSVKPNLILSPFKHDMDTLNEVDDVFNTTLDELDDVFDNTSEDIEDCIEECDDTFFGCCDSLVLRRTTLGKRSIADDVMESELFGAKNCAALSSINSTLNMRTAGEIMDAIATDKYETIVEKGFKSVLSNPTSTFRTTCNNVSMDIVLNKLMKYRTIDKSVVRIEELFNYYNFDLENKTGAKFTVETELCNKPWSKNKLLFIGVKAQEEIPIKQNIVILLDISGSMSDNAKETQASVISIVSKLKPGDRLSLIGYSDNDKVLIDNIEVDEHTVDRVIEELFGIDICGCTYASKGLETAYKNIENNMITGGINRVVVITDGDFNFGVHSIDGVEKLILEKKKIGAQLSIIGCGDINTNDELMNTLAKNGDGNYCFVSNAYNVNRNIIEKYNKLMFSVAKDVKAQVEFNPKYVAEYRLLGYENREISHEDFKNDKVIAEPFGSGAHAVAVYELKLNDEFTKLSSDYKYQVPVLIDSNELCTVKIRYKELNEEVSKEISKEVIYDVSTVMGSNSKLAYVLYVVGEYLRKSNFITEKDVERARMILLELEGTILDDVEFELLEELLYQ